MTRAVALGDQTRVGELVERALLEADRERSHRLCGLLRGERCERSGVDPAREQHADRDVGQQVRPHGVAQPGAQLLDQLGLVVVAQLGDRDRRGPRVALEAHVAVLPDEHVPRRELAGLAEDRQRRRDRVEGEEGLERVEVDLPARQRAELGGELEPVAVGPVVERLDPVAVAREHEPPAGRVPERDREHPAQAPEEGRGPPARTGGRAPRCRRACGRCGRRARARRAARGSCRARRSGRRGRCRPRSLSAGRRSRGR